MSNADGTTTATLNTTVAALQGIFGTDIFDLNKVGAVGTFISSDVGTAKIVTVSGLTISGADSGNYALIQPTTVANITPVPVTENNTTIIKGYENVTNPGGLIPPSTSSNTQAPDQGSKGTVIDIVNGDIINLADPTSSSNNNGPASGNAQAPNQAGASEDTGTPLSDKVNAGDATSTSTSGNTASNSANKPQTSTEDITETEEVAMSDGQGDLVGSNTFDNTASGDDGQPPSYDGKSYKKKYKAGKYRTVVIVIEGRVAVAGYTDKGPDYANAKILVGGEKVERIGRISG